MAAEKSISILSALRVGASAHVEVGDITVETHLHATDAAAIAAELVRLLPQLQTATPTSATSSQSCHTFQLPPENLQQINRSELLKSLADALNSIHGAVISQSIVGLGGVGKTQLAQAYVQAIVEHQAITDISIHYDYIFWLHAEISLGSQFQMLARDYCGIEKCKIPEAIQAVYAFLRDKVTLIVFDNVESSESLRPYLPPADYQSSLHLLITSRNGNWGAILTFALNGFTLEETEQFVTKVFGIPQNVEHVRVLHETLGGLPLALSHALAYIKQGHCTLVEYPEVFRRDTEHLFSDDEYVDDPHPKTVGATIALCLFQIGRRAPTAELILDLTAYLASENIPITLLAECLSRESVETVRQNIEVLTAYSLVTLTAFDCINVHRLVQAAFRHKHRKKENVELHLIPLMNHLNLYLKYDEEDTEQLASVSVYIPHAMACLDFIQAFIESVHYFHKTDKSVDFVEKHADLLLITGLYLIAIRDVVRVERYDEKYYSFPPTFPPALQCAYITHSENCYNFVRYFLDCVGYPRANRGNMPKPGIFTKKYADLLSVTERLRGSQSERHHALKISQYKKAIQKLARFDTDKLKQKQSFGIDGLYFPRHNSRPKINTTCFLPHSSSPALVMCPLGTNKKPLRRYNEGRCVYHSAPSSPGENSGAMFPVNRSRTPIPKSGETVSVLFKQ